MEARNAKGDSSAQVGHRDTVLREGNESQTQAYGVCVFLPRGSFYFFVPVATQPAVPFSLKNPVGGQMGPRTRPVRWGQFFPKSTEFGPHYTTFAIVFNTLQASIPTSWTGSINRV